VTDEQPSTGTSSDGARDPDGGIARWLAPSRPAPPTGCYVHLPFCVSVCPYCDFVVVAGARGPAVRSLMSRYVPALRTELELRADALDARWGPPGTAERPPLTSLYLGGGTPSLLGPEAIAGLISLVGDRYGVAPDAEVTLEANPGPDDRGDPLALRQAGVTRISFGAQSLDRDALHRVGRQHGPEDVAAAVEGAHRAGIGSVGLDLLTDIPGQPLRAWVESLEAAIALRPEHLSVYALTLDDPDAEGLTGPRGDHLPLRSGARRWRTRARADQDEGRAADAYRIAGERLAANGYVGYEISNWARAGAECRHNLGYWTGRPWEAAGVGSHAFDGRTRRWDAASIGPYLDALDPPDGRRPSLPPGGSEEPDERTMVADRLILGLRLRAGVPKLLSEAAPLRDVAPWAIAAGLLEEADDRLRLTLSGRLLADEVFVRLV
jgi:putative oxygen-independent coproporphyrinogen III oxidase